MKMRCIAAIATYLPSAPPPLSEAVEALARINPWPTTDGIHRDNMKGLIKNQTRIGHSLWKTKIALVSAGEPGGYEKTKLTLSIRRSKKEPLYKWIHRDPCFVTGICLFLSKRMNPEQKKRSIHDFPEMIFAQNTLGRTQNDSNIENIGVLKISLKLSKEAEKEIDQMSGHRKLMMNSQKEQSFENWFYH